MKPAPEEASGVPQILSVKALASYLRERVRGDAFLRAVAIRGEVTNVRLQSSGHLNFSMSEGTSLLQCFAFADDAARFPELKAGVQIVAYGQVAIYEERSLYQLVARRIERESVGDAHAIFERLKKKLAAEGLFEASRKRRLPAYPFRVALVSSKRAAGALDFVKLLKARRPHVSVVWCETSVQGPSAPAEIAGALGYASRLDVDAIVLTRGGGSFEDLLAFSDERVVRAVAAAKHPVLCAVGHSIDLQLADFAADVHAETPSDAAERVGRETRDLREMLAESARRATRAVALGFERGQTRMERARRGPLGDARLLMLRFVQQLQALVDRLELQDPRVRLEQRRSRLVERRGALERAMRDRLGVWERTRVERARALEPAVRARLERAAGRLALRGAQLGGNDPEAILQKGYAIVTHAGRVVIDPRDAPPGSTVRARLGRGTLSARVEAGTPDGDERGG